MSEIEVEQLDEDDLMAVDTPNAIWRTALGRAIFGFHSEISSNPYFVSDEYIQRLCEIENAAQSTLGKFTAYAIVFSMFAIAAAGQALGAASALAADSSNDGLGLGRRD